MADKTTKLMMNEQDGFEVTRGANGCGVTLYGDGGYQSYEGCRVTDNNGFIAGERFGFLMVISAENNELLRFEYGHAEDDSRIIRVISSVYFWKEWQLPLAALDGVFMPYYYS